MPLLSRVGPGALGASLVFASCGSNDSSVADAGPCWPLNATPGGQVELGTGDIAFAPMPDTAAIIRGLSQSDPYLQVHARIRGLPPGDPSNVFDPRNPKTKASAVIADLALTLGVECPASLGYIASPSSPQSGEFDLSPHSLRVGFGSFPSEQALGKQALITIEVVGSNGLYAKAEKLVTLVPMPAAAGMGRLPIAPSP